MRFEDGPPNMQVLSGALCMYHGRTFQYHVRKTSDLLRGDRVGSGTGYILLENINVKYKACSRALHAKYFRMEGDYDCANGYIGSGINRDIYLRLPKLQADCFYPYYFEPDYSPLRGRIAFSNRLPHESRTPARRITAINISSRGSFLRNLLESPQILYLGGDHSPSCLDSKRNMSLPDPTQLKKSSTYAEYRNAAALNPHHESKYSLLIISSPFEDTYTTTCFGLNVAFAKLFDGKFVYWATSSEPEPGLQISKLPVTEVPLSTLRSAKGNHCFSLYDEMSPSRDGAQLLPFEKFVEKAWVMRGERLTQTVDEESYPEGVLPRLRGGFCRVDDEQILVDTTLISSRFRKAIASIQRLGSERFGFSTSSIGAAQCDIHSLAKHLEIPEDILLAFFAKFGSSHQYVRGALAFLGMQEMEGLFEIMKPVPVGQWMAGLMVDTGAGLLYTVTPRKYFRAETHGGVSWLSEYTGPGIKEARKLSLGDYLASVPQMGV